MRKAKNMRLSNMNNLNMSNERNIPENESYFMRILNITIQKFKNSHVSNNTEKNKR